MSLAFGGAVIEVAVRDIGRSEAFYTVLIGRSPDLQVRTTEREWRLHETPEVALRVVVDAERAGRSHSSIGVRDIGVERARLASSWPEVPAPTVRPNVIALLQLRDPDGNPVTLWQDLLVRS